jgi:phosphoribosylamine--glycine ligase
MTTAPTRTLIVGSGAREHALAWKLASEPGMNLVVVVPGSDAISQEPRVKVVPLPAMDPDAIVDLARSQSIELVVVGPELPLAQGFADAVLAAGIPTFGPTAAAARIESSKTFCHEVAAAANVRMARCLTGNSFESTMAAVTEIARTSEGFVVKLDGLAAGKGVQVFDSSYMPYVRNSIEDIYPDPESEQETVVVEERLFGPEASVIAITDGHDVVALPPSRDHKRLEDGDKGPNTGGMGAYSPLPDLSDRAVNQILDTVHRPILRELAKRGTPFVGFLYAGLMLTKDGPILLECNARLGDPEAQVILPRLGGPLGPVLHAAARGQLGPFLDRIGSPALLPVLPGAAVGIVIAGAGYPWRPSVGQPVLGVDKAVESGGLIFHAGTKRLPNGEGWLTNGGRILTVVGRGPDLKRAREVAERAADLVSTEGLQRRRDIGARLPATRRFAVGVAS